MIAHLDTGVAANHPAFAGRIAAGMSVDREGRLTDEFPDDDDGHGTATASLALAHAPPDAALHVVKALNGGAVITRILVGLSWIATQPVRVACLAIGVRGRTPVFAPALASLRQRGILPVVSIGNGGAGRASAPGWYPGVLSVGAVDAAGEVPALSASDNDAAGRCLAPALLAPGMNLLAADRRGRRSRVSGTSMAAATVAGMVATLLDEHPDATIEAGVAALQHTARPPACGRWHHVVHGVVDLDGARRALARGDGDVGEVPPTRRGSTPFCDRRLLRQCHRAAGRPVPTVVIYRADTHPERLAAGLTELGVTGLRHLPLARAIVGQMPPTLLPTLRREPALEALSAVDIDYPNV